MDTEHRHELKENDLAQFLANFGQWWSRHGFKSLLIVLVVLVIAVGWRVVRAKARQSQEQTWAELATTSSPSVFEVLGRNAARPAVARALANLRAASLYNDRASLPGAAGRAEAEDAESAEAGLLDRVEALIQMVLDDDQVPQLLKLNAWLIQGAAKETAGRFDQAKSCYLNVLKGDGFLFDLPATELAQLVSGLVSPQMRDLFASHDQALLPDAVVRALDSSGRWALLDDGANALFLIDLTVQENMDRGHTIPEEARAQFEARGLFLPLDTTVTVHEPARRWSLQHGNDAFLILAEDDALKVCGPRFHVLKEGTMVNVYEAAPVNHGVRGQAVRRLELLGQLRNPVVFAVEAASKTVFKVNAPPTVASPDQAASQLDQDPDPAAQADPPDAN